MASTSFHFPLAPIVVACTLLLAATAACAQQQQQPASPTTTLSGVVVSARSTAAPVDVAGFGDIPLERLPLSAVGVPESALKDRGGQGLRELTRFDASVGDAYNSIGYWDALTVRGFALDLRNNVRRDGLPITGETFLPLDNKSRVELLKGTSGLQAGISAPGGLMNLAVKRPDEDRLSASVEARGSASVLGAIDWSTRFGDERVFGLRVNAAAERLDPPLRAARGERSLLALAGDWRVSKDTLIEAELETGRRSQPSQPGFSLLGDTVPSADDSDPRINLNNQAWALPVVFRADYASLRWQQRLNADWRAQLHAGVQRARTDDRIAFPFGCYDAGTDIYYADRYCPDGRFDLYDYRSENEQRDTAAVDASVSGRLNTGGVSHQLRFGAQGSKLRTRFQQQAYNFVGQGTIDGGTVLPADPALNYDNTNRDERRTELYANDAIEFGHGLGLWLGLRHTRLRHQSIRTSGDEATDIEQSFTTPWIAASWAPVPGQLLYASWGEGVESDVAPNRARYTNPGQPLAALKSRQAELGFKASTADLNWGIAAFDIRRPTSADIGACDLDATCTRQNDGDAVHRGIEANAQARLQAWTLGASAMLLRARREGSIDPALNGSRPANVPERSARAYLGYDAAAIPGLRVYAALTAEGDRAVMPGADAPTVPGWARIDLGGRYEHSLVGGQRLVWRAGIDNAFDRRAWQEAPYQFGHIYLYPMAPRTFWLSVQADL
ncbi:TonB-dependent siderophore receptor [Rivibacter subsaxonicus]|uniref:Iron complex outermembrane receptor protein n=1 Tax=Rivibacter subsaxonicus TaxID=457575 RepID=A0A4V2FSC0_9BURK|nr:TonB-dependent siderophore receptor [Rivibacter subsaxonicus]RZT93729.1 iron complex outermembrane receptor protein [Rivibacter subsaxonicus]